MVASATQGGILAPVALNGGGPNGYPHALVLIHKTQARDGHNVPMVDDYNQPIAGTPVETKFRGYLVELSAAKIHQANEAGRTIGTDMLKAPPSLPVTADDQIRWDITGDLRRYEVNGNPRPAGGREHHIEIPLQLVDQ